MGMRMSECEPSGSSELSHGDDDFLAHGLGLLDLAPDRLGSVGLATRGVDVENDRLDGIHSTSLVQI